MGGRRLRIERGRIVWKANSRNPHDDDLVSFFESGRAKIVIRDIGCSLVKARGEFRTQVPKNILAIYESLQGAPMDSDTCFVCRLACKQFCPLCKLWGHGDCVRGLACKICKWDRDCAGGHEDANQDDLAGAAGADLATIGVALANTFGSNCPDHSPGVVASFLGFDKASEEYPDHGCMEPPFQLAHGACFLCGCLLDHVAVQMGLGPGLPHMSTTDIGME